MNIPAKLFVSFVLVLGIVGVSTIASASPAAPGRCHLHQGWFTDSYGNILGEDSAARVQHCGRRIVIRGPIYGSPNRYRLRRNGDYMPPYIVIVPQRQRAHRQRRQRGSFGIRTRDGSFQMRW
ncbi:MAG: hypothetical protein JKX80_01280 [Candidatus Pacebacteria bacterium]|nr:hypothetical protein [Candidatus Paceibacterota bacterium]